MKLDKFKEIHAKTGYSQIVKSQQQQGNLESSKREAPYHIQGILYYINRDFSSETVDARKQCDDIFKVLKGRGIQSRILYPTKLSLKK